MPHEDLLNVMKIIVGLKFRAVHRPPLWTGSTDYLRTGPRATPTDPSTNHPQNKTKEKNKNKDFTYSLTVQ